MTIIRYWFIPTVGTLIAGLALMSCTPSNSVHSELSPEATPIPSAADSLTANTSAPSTNGSDRSGEAMQKVIVVDSLERPWGMAWLPDGALLVTERPGRLRIIRDGVLDPAPVRGVPEVLAVGQGGLLDVSVHPRFAENQWVYFTYAHGTAAANRTRVARARLNGSTLTDWTVIFEVNRSKQSGQHFGSRIVWLPDRTMLVSIGDGGNPPIRLDGEWIRNQAQNLENRLGKIVRLNDDGSVPADNPFVGTPDADSAVWSYGHRNIQGMAFDPVSKKVWVTEHGARGGDELNRIEPGENYGWPVVTHSREYSGGEISSERSRPGMVDPLVVWTPATAPSGLMVYRGDRFPQWQGDLFAGGLVSKDVRQIKLDGAGTVVSETSIPIGQRVRDVRQGPDGSIYILTDESNGRLIRLEPG